MQGSSRRQKTSDAFWGRPASELGAMPVIHNRPVAPGRRRSYQPRQWMPGVPEIADLRSAALAK